MKEVIYLNHRNKNYFNILGEARDKTYFITNLVSLAQGNPITTNQENLIKDCVNLLKEEDTITDFISILKNNNNEDLELIIFSLEYVFGKDSALEYFCKKTNINTHDYDNIIILESNHVWEETILPVINFIHKYFFLGSSNVYIRYCELSDYIIKVDKN